MEPNLNYSVPAIFATDAYKLSHSEMYPEGMELLFSTWVPRSDRLARTTSRQLDGDNSVVFFGITQTMNKMESIFGEWFDRDTEEVVDEYIDFIKLFLKVTPNALQVERIRDLHELGYLPIKVLYLPEGTVTKTGVCQAVIFNTLPEFAWVTNYLETLFSTLQWNAQTVASIARNYRKLCDEFAELTCENNLHVDWQCHDFSMRGLSSLETSSTAQLGHLLYFNGTDTLPTLFEGQKLYEDFDIATFGSVPASEHSVMCAHGEMSETDTFRHIMKAFPVGIASIVSDTWDFWKVLTVTLPELKDEIMQRDGKIVIRPDSGDPVDIICGDANAEWGSPASQGAIQLLWDVFGGTVNAKGYKVLDQHIGLIYGDSITLDRAKRIFERLAANGFASSNVVLGVGSFTYQCNTRDTYGFAMKATGAIVSGEERALFKDPVTDDGTKTSFKGFLSTRYDEVRDEYYTVDRLTFDEAVFDPESAFIEHDFEFVSNTANSWEEVRWLARQ
jgi:nicotinamide phosphoribosyltransferase